MQDHVTLLPPHAPSTGARGLSSTLPPDLLEQVRRRLRLLTLLLLFGFAFDPFLYFVAWAVASLAEVPLRTGSFARTGFLAVNAGAVLAPAALWWAAGSLKVPARELSGRLAAIHGTDAWTEARARDWWARHQPTRV